MKNRNSSLSVILLTIRKKAVLSFAILLAVTGAIVTSLLPPLVLETIVNQLTGRNPVSLSLILLYFGLIALTGLLDAARESLLTVFGQKITHALRSELCAKLNRLPADTFAAADPGITVSRFVGDVDTVEELFTSGIISMFADTCRLISIFVMIFFRNRGLAIVLLIELPLLFAYTRHVQKNMLKAQIDNRRAIGRASGLVPETIRCIRTIHNLQKENWMEEKYDQAIQDSFQAMEKTNFYDAVYSPVILILNALTIAVIMALAALGNPAVHAFFGMSVGTSVAVISYVTQVFTPLESIGMEIQTIQSAAAGVHRIDEFLARPEREETDPAIDMEKACRSGAVCIEAKHTAFGYRGDHRIFTDLNLVITAGEHVTITGRTGAGKSTLFRLLLGMYRPQEGTVKIYGQDAARIPDKQKRKLFGYVEQSFRRVPGTVRDQITLYDASLSQEDVIRAARTAGLHETILSLENGYDTLCREELFSQGQWQLLAIARAIAADPRILLLDEITANLDADTEQTVLSALQRAGKDRTVISISHRLYEHTGGRRIVLSGAQEG